LFRVRASIDKINKGGCFPVPFLLHSSASAQSNDSGERKKTCVRNAHLGSSMIESVVGLTLLIPMSLLFVDLAALVLAQTANDALAKEAARTAAQQNTNALATSAAQTVINNFAASKLMNVTGYTTNYTNDSVTVQTNITCTLPIPLPFVGIKTQNFVAQSTEPVVGNLPSATSTGTTTGTTTTASAAQ
jgi:Flp pilus assembly protein TadG